MKNKYISVTEPFLPPLEEYTEYLSTIWDNKWVTNMGPFFNEYKSKVKKYLSVDGLYPTLNGTIALELAIKTLGIKGKYIITTPFTFVATTLSIINTGNFPVFCDIDPDTGNMDYKRLEEIIKGNDDIAAILPVHVYGEPVDILGIEKIASKYDLFTIYDAAHCFGTEYKGKGIGTFGNFSIFSTHATKVFNTIEGGLITYNGNNPDVDRILHLSCNFGINETYDLVYPGNNGKMNELQASMGILQLKYINSNIKKREEVVDLYKKYLNPELIFTKYNSKDVKYSYPYFIIKSDKRNKIEKELLKKGISSRKYFYPISSEFSLVKDSYDYQDMKHARILSKKVLAIPLHHNLTEEDVINISNIINKIT